ncbi:MAG: ketopantoate reductase family protein [Halanaerobiales bacterium]|nr:ketopantoate reductase family protein [Halanaerobiales bacterium]
MKIAIIGAGAMGSLFGGYLSKSGNEVTLIDIWEEHVNKIKNKGLVIKKDDKEIHINPKAKTTSEDLDPVDLVIIFVKSIYTEDAVTQNLSIINEDTKVLSLQNGIGNIEKIAANVDKNNIIAGTTSHGATLLGPGRIKHAGEGDTHIGSIEGDNIQKVQKVKKVLEEAGFVTKTSDNVLKLIWDKLLINIGINALTAILKIKNGQIVEYKESEDLLKMLVNEAIDVAEKKGLKFNRSEIISKVKEVAEMTCENRSSMLQDVSNKRETEITTINGAIVKQAEEYSLDVPANKIVTKMIKTIEYHY